MAISTISRKGNYANVYETERGREEKRFPVFRQFKGNEWKSGYIIADERTIIQFMFKYNHLNYCNYNTMNINRQVEYEEFKDIFEMEIIDQNEFSKTFLIPFAEATEKINTILADV